MLKLPNEETNNLGAATYPELKGELEVDVAVVGGGITGLSTAYLLQQSGMKVAVIEKNTLASGTTGGTTGKVTSQHGLTYAMYVERYGEAMARAYGQANQDALDKIEEIIRREKIDCNLERDDNYVYTSNPDRIQEFKKEAKVADKLGLPASFETNLSLPFKVRGAVKFANQAKFQAKLYVEGLARSIHDSGGHVFENSNVVDLQNDGPTMVRTKHGKIMARDIVVATKVPCSPLFARASYCLLEYPTTSYIVASQNDAKLEGMYISPDKNNYSILSVGYGKDRFLLVGGENHIPGTSRKSIHYQRLANYAEEFLAVTKIDYRWRAMDYIAYDDVPLIGQVYRWSNHLYTATGFRKWGLTTSMVAASILHDQIVGNAHPLVDMDTQLYRPIKYIPKTAKRYLRRGV